MAVFTAGRTARKAHKCSRCGCTIRPGERYTSISITPGGEMGYLGWSRLAEHWSFVDCDYELAAEPLPDASDVTAYIESQADVLRLLAALKAVLELHQPVDRGTGSQCKGCATHVTFTPWPCPTYLAISREITRKEESDE